MINRSFFFKTIRERLFSGSLNQSQVNGLVAILDCWEKRYAKQDDRWLAYALATAFHETDKKMQGIREYGLGKGKKYGVKHPVTGQVYYGRGLVQLTWYQNYQSMSRILGVDLVNNPDLALDLELSVRIMFIGMINGIFTGKKLVQYFGPNTEYPIKARAIINGKDKANLIADFYYKFYSAISHTV